MGELKIPKTADRAERWDKRGKQGRKMMVRANHFPAQIRLKTVFHYDVKFRTTFRRENRLSDKDLFVRAFTELKRTSDRLSPHRFRIIFDGWAIAYSTMRLPFGSGDTFEGSVTVPVVEDIPNKTVTVKITLNLAREVDMEGALHQYSAEGSTATRPQVTIKTY